MQGDTAAVGHDRLVGQRQDLSGLLLDDHGGKPFFRHDAAQGRQKFIDDDRRQSLERFIQQQHTRIVVKNSDFWVIAEVVAEVMIAGTLISLSRDCDDT